MRPRVALFDLARCSGQPRTRWGGSCCCRPKRTIRKGWGTFWWPSSSRVGRLFLAGFRTVDTSFPRRLAIPALTANASLSFPKTPSGRFPSRVETRRSSWRIEKGSLSKARLTSHGVRGQRCVKIKVSRAWFSEPWGSPLLPVDLVDGTLCVGHCLNQPANAAQQRVEVSEHLVAAVLPVFQGVELFS